MNDTKSLAAFVRAVIKEGAVNGSRHEFVEAAKDFYANVTVLRNATADEWFNGNKDKAEVIDAVYEAYMAPDVAQDETDAATSDEVTEADNTVSELEKLQARVLALEDALKPAQEETPAAEEPPAKEE